MPRNNGFFDNLNDEPLLSERESIDVLHEYCDENNIPLWSLRNSAIEDFIETVRYAPHHIETEEIARRVGIHPTQNQSRYYINNVAIADQLISASELQLQSVESLQPRMVQATNRLSVGQSLSLENVLTEAITPDMLSNVVTPYREGEFDDLITEMSWSSSPNKKKRKRSEYDMVKELVRGENFPRPNFKDWSDHREYEDIVHDWYGNVDYREQWIFSRREREGFNRRNIGFFSLDDVMARMSKRKNPHPLDSSFSKFYDWKLGGTDWILRLELFQHEQYYFLITRHIHKPTDTEIKFDVRYWSHDRFKEINCVWCQQKNNDVQFDRVFGSNDENSPYYVRPYEEEDGYYDYDHDDEYYEEDDYDSCEPCEDSSF